MDYTYLRTTHGIMKCGQVSFQVLLSVSLGSVLDIKDSTWISIMGCVFTAVMLCINIATLVVGIRRPLHLNTIKIAVECLNLFIWILFWLLEYTFAGIAVASSRSVHEKSESILFYNYELGYVLTSIMMMLQIILVLILMKIAISNLVANQKPRTPSPVSDFEVLDVAEPPQNQPLEQNVRVSNLIANSDNESF